MKRYANALSLLFLGAVLINCDAGSTPAGLTEPSGPPATLAVLMYADNPPTPLEVKLAEGAPDQTASSNMLAADGPSLALLTPDAPNMAVDVNVPHVVGIPFAPEPSPATLIKPSFCDDCVSEMLPIGFDFKFFGVTYNKYYVSSNGFLGFIPVTNSACCNLPTFPNATPPNAIVAFAWTDLNPSNGGAVKIETRGTAPNRRLVVAFENVPWHNDATQRVTTQVILRERTNEVEIHTTSMTATHMGPYSTQGVEDPTGKKALFVSGRVKSANKLTNDAVRFVTQSPDLATPVSIGLGNLKQVYDGTPRIPSVFTTPGGVTVQLKYGTNASTTAPVSVGSFPVTATPVDPAFVGSATGTLVVEPASQAISFPALPDRTYGDAAFTVTAAGGPSTSPVTFSLGAGSVGCALSGSTVTITGATATGQFCTIVASQAGDANHTAAADVVRSFAIARAVPQITWAPQSLTLGEALGAAQLSAVAAGVDGVSLAGTFTYSPAAGTVLPVGSHNLSATFTPTDVANYTDASATTTVAVRYSTVAGHYFLAPVNRGKDPISAFRIRSTIPVKFQLFGADGVTPVSSAVATISVSRVPDVTATAVEQAVVSTVPDQGNRFRYDVAGEHYIFNLSTDAWTPGFYRITASLDDGSTIVQDVEALGQ